VLWVILYGESKYYIEKWLLVHTHLRMSSKKITKNVQERSSKITTKWQIWKFSDE